MPCPRPLSPDPRRHRVVVVGGAALLTVLSAAVSQPAQARPEAGPHAKPWDGFDLRVTDTVTGKHGVIVQTFAHSDEYCIELSHGWNAIPLQHRSYRGSGAKLILVNHCGKRDLIGSRVWFASPNEIWTLDSGSVHR
ncbi:hypothetical protein ACR8AL_12010 [Clavibacter sepedonicus]|uniref:hypothetical protein n=1 Tax=Clavibacter TaxID=1573 RepID=UPI001055B2DC|nr:MULTISPECIES: hypothetical protein [Clavibacter]MBD5382764.1 hypothetical protein [Clavibacter sp.]UUK65200.1 hypothetical protein LRE50_13085 [Clavibacter sepedonicus]